MLLNIKPCLNLKKFNVKIQEDGMSNQQVILPLAVALKNLI